MLPQNVCVANGETMFLKIGMDTFQDVKRIIDKDHCVVVVDKERLINGTS